MATFRSGQEGIFAYGLETLTFPVDPNDPALLTVPSLYHAGYYDVPGIETNENAQVIPAAGTYRGIQTVKGAREHTIRNNLRIGNGEFLRYALRSSAAIGSGGGSVGPGFTDPAGGALTPTLYKGLPIVCMAGGAMDLFDSAAAFSWVGRMGMLREVGINFQEGAVSPLVASCEFWPLFIQRDAAALAAINTLTLGTVVANEANIIDSAGEVLMWQHATWKIAGTEYRDIISSISVKVTNDLRRVGLQRDLGDDNVLSRVPYSVVPLQENVSIQVGLHDKLPDAFINAANDSGNLGKIEVFASNLTGTPVNGQKELRITINNNRLASHGMQQVQPNALLEFSASIVSRAIRIDQAVYPDTIASNLGSF